MYSLLSQLPVEIRTSPSGPRKAGMLVKGQEGIQSRGFSRSTWVADPAEETGNNHICWAVPRQHSASPGLAIIWNRLWSTGDSWMVFVSQVEILLGQI